MTEQQEIATLAGGCFWCLDSVFRDLKGVQKVESGYAGGHTKNPSYRDVCSGTTGHAEVVQVTFDPSAITFRDLLGVFFTIHDPTTLNRQGPDVGTQYRSAIFFHDADQEKVARDSKAVLEAKHAHNRPIVTQILPATDFYRAEDYHQQYFEKQGIRSCHI